MRPILKLGVGVLATIGAIYLGLLISTVFVRRCEHNEFATAESPDGLWIARALYERCDNRPAQVLAVLEDRRSHSYKSLLTAEPTSTDIRLTWARAGALQISVPGNLRYDEGAPSSDGVTVEITRR